MKDDAGQFHQMVIQHPEVGQKRTINSKRPKNPTGHETFRRRFFRELESGADIFLIPMEVPSVVFRGLIPPRSVFGGLEISGWKKHQDQLHLAPFFAFFGDSGNKSLQIHPFSWQLDDENTRQTGRFLHNLTAAPVGVHPMVRGPTRAEARGGIDEQLGWKTAKNLQRAKPVDLDTFFSQLIVIMLRLLRVMFELSHSKRDMYSKACEFGYFIFFSISICCWRNQFLGLPTMEIQTCLLPKPEVNVDLSNWIVWKTPHTKIRWWFQRFSISPRILGVS